MSYDITVGDQEFNYTYNLANFFADHIDGERRGLWELNDKTGLEAFHILKKAFDKISITHLNLWKDNVKGCPDFCDKYDAPNGWGSTVGAIIFLGCLMAACADNPNEIVSVS